MKKFLIIPILIFVYIFLIDVLSQVSFQAESSAPTTSSGDATIINIGQSVSVSVTRPYLFGLINLPTYTDALGNIGIYHDMFFTFIFILTIALIIIEVKNRKDRKLK